MARTLAVACDNEGPPLIFSFDVEIKGRQYVAVGKIERLPAIVDSVVADECREGYLPVARCIDAAASIEHAGLIADGAQIRPSVGVGVIYRSVPFRIGKEAGGMNEEDIHLRLGWIG